MKLDRPHCYGKMTWILKYPEDETPKSSICNCECTNSCLRLTRNKASESKEVKKIEKQRNRKARMGSL